MDVENAPLDEESLPDPVEGEGSAEEITGLREVMWRQELELLGARNTIAELRQSIAIVTTAGAELAAALMGREGMTATDGPVPAIMSEAGDLTASIAAIENDLETATTRRLEAEGRLAEHETRVSELQDQLAAAQAESEWMAAGKAAAENALLAQTGAWEDVRNQLAELRTQLPENEGAAANLAGLTGEEAAAEGAEGVLAEIAGLAAGITALHLRVQQKDEALTAASAIAGADASQLETQSAALAEAQDRISSLESQVADLESTLAQQKARGDDSESAAKLAALVASVAAGAKALREKDAELEEANSHITSLQDQVAKLHAEIETKEQAFGELDSGTGAGAEASRTAGTVDVTIEAQPGRIAGKTAAIESALIAGVRPQATTVVQDLAQLKGIGAVYEQRLYENGVGTFWEVANLSNDELISALKMSKSMQKQIDLNAVRADALRLARETYSMGHIWEGTALDDMQQINGIGEVMEQRLYNAGVRTYDQLAAITLEQLQSIIGDAEPFEPDFINWINQARILAQRRSRS